MNSSSFININGDLKQNKLKILIYLILNFIQNLYYSLFSRKFKFIKFNPKNKKYNFNKNHSISRKLCGVFWKNINWNIIIKNLGKLSVSELGSGDGKYFKNDISINPNYIKKYKGYDIVFFDNWNKIKTKKYSFQKFDGNSFKKIISKNYNLFLSQSCLEHVKNDLRYFSEIKKKANQSKKKNYSSTLCSESILSFYLFNSWLSSIQ